MYNISVSSDLPYRRRPRMSFIEPAVCVGNELQYAATQCIEEEGDRGREPPLNYSVLPTRQHMFFNRQNLCWNSIQTGVLIWLPTAGRVNWLCFRGKLILDSKYFPIVIAKYNCEDCMTQIDTILLLELISFHYILPKSHHICYLLQIIGLRYRISHIHTSNKNWSHFTNPLVLDITPSYKFSS